MDYVFIWTVIGTGVAVVGIIYTFLRNFKEDIKEDNERFKTEIKEDNERFKTEIKEQIDQLDRKIDKLDEKVTDIDRRLCRLEGAFTSKECCRIQDERHLKKAE